MSIWLYSAQSGHNLEDLVVRTSCLFCSTLLDRYFDDEENEITFEELNYGLSDGFRTRADAVIGICPVCGWWKYGVSTTFPPFGEDSYVASSHSVKHGILKALDLSDLKIPLEEVRSYLAAHFEARFDLHPRAFEEVVASVFRDQGYSALVTAYSGDGGIDVIMEGPEGKTIGVQVKRYKSRISVEQIRELTGALVIGGYTKGIFVTTSGFQAGVEETVKRSESRGYPIELYDAERFYGALKIAQVSSSRQIFDHKPWGETRKWN